MTEISVLRYPDARLENVCAPVVAFDADLQRLAADLLMVMRAAPGVGITAAHVGIPLRLVVIELDPADGVRTYVNPQVAWTSDETGLHMEGSVCMPGATEQVARPQHIRFRYQDLAGSVHEEEADGFLAVCIQHEIDQLDGIFWLRRLSKLKRDRLIRKWEKSRTTRKV